VNTQNVEIDLLSDDALDAVAGGCEIDITIIRCPIGIWKFSLILIVVPAYQPRRSYIRQSKVAGTGPFHPFINALVPFDFWAGPFWEAVVSPDENGVSKTPDWVPAYFIHPLVAKFDFGEWPN